MNSITEVLRNKRPGCSLIPFITAGYPDLDTCIKALYTLDRQGADVIELGIPYSDALADGPIIQESSKLALEQGTYIETVLGILNTVKATLRVPIVIFTYYNPILNRGIEKFIREISLCGAKGLIIPDLPVEELDYLIELCANFSIELILFVSPTSSPVRISSILSKSPGCIYLLSSNGVTGCRKEISSQVNDLAISIKKKTDKFIILGFGISNSKQASRIAKWNIDGIVIGSAFIQSMLGKSSHEALDSLSLFCSQIRSAIDQ